MPLFRTLSPRHRRMLAGLGVLIVAAGVFVLDASERQRHLNGQVAAVKGAGGSVWLAAPYWQQKLAKWRNYAVSGETWVSLKGSSFDDQWVHDHENLSDLQIDMLTITDCPITADGVARILTQHPLRLLLVNDVADCDSIAAVLASEESLLSASFDNTDLTDTGFSSLPLEQLAVVGVAGSQVTPEGLQELQRCRRLNLIWLDGRQLDDSVAELLRVQSDDLHLFLVGKDVTDAHLARMHGMRVRRVELTDTSVTPEGIASLKKSLPNCQVRVYSTTPTDRSIP